jgi:hypothetical protein
MTTSERMIVKVDLFPETGKQAALHAAGKWSMP